MDNFTVSDLRLHLGVIGLAEGVLHPLYIVTLGEIVTSVSTTGFLSVLSSVHGHLTLDEEVLKFHGLNQVGVPDLSTIGNSDSVVVLGNSMEFLASFFEVVLSTEDSSISGHAFLEFKTELSGGVITSRVTESIEVSDGLLSGIRSKFSLSLSRFEFLSSSLSGTTSKNDQIQKRVSTKTVSSMDGSTSSFSSSKESTDFVVITLRVGINNLSFPVSGDTSHVVMDSRSNGYGFFCRVNTSEDVSGLEDTRETLLQGLWGQMVKMQVNVVTILTDTTAFEDFHGHGTGDDITRGQILSGGGVSLHETFSMLVSENTTFSTAAFSHEASSTVDSGGMELNEFGILNGKSSTGDHTTTISSAGVSGCATLVSSTVTTSGQDSLVGTHSMDSTISHVVSHNSLDSAVSSLKEIHGEVLNEENSIVTKSTSHQGVEHRVTSSISDAAASVGLSTLTKVLRLSSEGSLVNLTFSSSRERHAIRLELADSDRGFSTHVLDSILVSKPVSSLDGIIEMPFP